MIKLVLATALATSAIAGCAKSDSAQATNKTEDNTPAMTVDEVDRALTAKEAQAVDCNSPNTRKRMGVVPGAILISDSESFAASELPADKTAKLVFYCANPG